MKGGPPPFLKYSEKNLIKRDRSVPQYQNYTFTDLAEMVCSFKTMSYEGILIIISKIPFFFSFKLLIAHISKQGFSRNAPFAPNSSIMIPHEGLNLSV